MGTIRSAAIASVIVLGGCGGGGGDSGSSTSLSVSPGSVQFLAEKDDPAPAATDLTAGWVGDGLLVGYAPGVPAPSWLYAALISDNNVSPTSVRVQPNTTALDPGLYQTSLRFVTGHTDGSAIKIVDVPIQFRVLPKFGATVDALSLEVVRGKPTPSGLIGVTKADNFWTAESDQAWLAATVVQSTGGGSGGGSVRVQPDLSQLADGDHTATITITETSSRHRQLSVPVTVSVREPSITGDRDSVFISALSDQPQLPAAQSVAITAEASPERDYTVAVSYSGGDPGWLDAIPGGRTPSTVSLHVNTTALAPGYRSATVTLTPTTSGLRPFSIQVYYGLGAATLSSSLGQAYYEITLNSPSSELDRVSVFPLADNGATLSWTAAAFSAPWLTTPTPSGSTQSASEFRVALDKSQVSQLVNGDYQVTIALRYHSPSMAEQTLVLHLRLILQVPHVTSIRPGYANTGQALSHIVRGSGFSTLGGAQLKFGSTAVADYQVVNDTEIRLTAPSLAAGSYPVAVVSPTGLSLPGAGFTVVDTPAFAAFDLPRTQGVGRVLYDPWRTAVYTMDRNGNEHSGPTVTRYRYSSGSWTADTLLALPDITDIALTNDGSAMLVSALNNLYRVDLSAASPTPVAMNLSYIARLEPLSDGRFFTKAVQYGCCGVGMSILDPHTATQTYAGFEECTHIKGSLDGGTVLIGGQCTSPNPPLSYFSATDGQIHTSGVLGLTDEPNMAASRSGDRRLIADRIFDGNYTELGAEGFGWGTVFAPDQNVVYGMQQEYDGSNPRLVSGDVSGPPQGTYYAPTRTWPLPPANQYDMLYSDIAISPDGKTAFVAHRSRFVVVPLN